MVASACQEANKKLLAAKPVDSEQTRDDRAYGLRLYTSVVESLIPLYCELATPVCGVVANKVLLCAGLGLGLIQLECCVVPGDLENELAEAGDCDHKESVQIAANLR
jgi:hypothetical protein